MNDRLTASQILIFCPKSLVSKFILAQIEDFFVDCYNLKRHGVYSALNWSFLVWGIYNLVKFVGHG